MFSWLEGVSKAAEELKRSNKTRWTYETIGGVMMIVDI